MNKTTTLLMILDGWGVAPLAEDNAIARANTPQWDQWWQTGQHTTLDASGHCVGLPETQVGNSEVGHMHIGAGRCIEQDLVRIDHAITTGELFTPLLPTIDRLQQQHTCLHLLGLLSEGGVHSHQRHLFALLNWLKQFTDLPVYIHAIMDGRDTAPQIAMQNLKQLQAHCQHRQKLASICGRYFAMDRDNRWQRTLQAYDLLTQTQPTDLSNQLETLLAHTYENEGSDEFIPPTALANYQPLQDNDALLCFNYRADRMRQLCRALTDPSFDGFQRKMHPKISLITLSQYDANLHAELLLKPMVITDHLGACVAKASMTQLRLAETEKYPHVTYFLNGGEESPLAGESRHMVPSPKVATYDQQPQMSASELTEVLVSAIAGQQFDLIVCNYANADMVGHTGNLEATVTAIEAIDHCFSQIEHARQQHQLQIVITADHGNAEKMFHTSLNQVHTSHTHSPVPFVYLGKPAFQLEPHPHASLIDLAPTMLTLMSLPIPQTMTGQSLLRLVK